MYFLYFFLWSLSVFLMIELCLFTYFFFFFCGFVFSYFGFVSFIFGLDSVSYIFVCLTIWICIMMIYSMYTNLHLIRFTFCFV